MILYDNKAWLPTAFFWNPPLIEAVAPRVILAGVWAYICTTYFADILIPAQAFSMLVGSVTFLTVMRATQSYNRYHSGCEAVTKLAANLRDLVRMTVSYARGTGSYEDDEKPEAREKMHQLWLDTSRLSIAVLIGAHLRAMIGFQKVVAPPGVPFGIDSDESAQIRYNRARLRGLLKQDEFEFIDHLIGNIEKYPQKCSSKQYKWIQSAIDFVDFRGEGGGGWKNQCETVIVLATMLSMTFKHHLNKPYGFVERAMNLLDEKISRSLELYQEIESNIAIPFPICFAQVNKLLLVMFLVAFPFVIDSEIGLGLNVCIPMIGAFIFCSIEFIAVEIEVCFGLDAQDVNILRFVRVLECECMTMLNLAETTHREEDGKGVEVCDKFVWVQVPGDYSIFSGRTCDNCNCSGKHSTAWCLALKSEASAAEALYAEETSNAMITHPSGYSSVNLRESR
eukprot:CAMPEP_0169066118 /NCGR_PEP_ID=MMETSP1015-20121227/2780_1 /TAXON_ID=342587 /ORGANISM="Karlodinium micrum, Strain CCMP2283" /LENGTH=451 /DNA_ID=CAMNT_0009124765 /DNA_START=67 /DNA_END=1422 /DNA_ORIENTATION=-